MTIIPKEQNIRKACLYLSKRKGHVIMTSDMEKASNLIEKYLLKNNFNYQGSFDVNKYGNILT